MILSHPLTLLETLLCRTRQGVRRAFQVLMAVLVSAVAGCQPQPTAHPPVPGSVSQGPPSRPAEYRIAPGDTLEVYVLEDDSFTGRYLVRNEGHIVFPKVGRVQVAGKDLREAERTIKASFEANQLREATIMVEREGIARPSVDRTSVSVYLSGSVGRTGRREIPSIGEQPPSLYQAILEAGDFTRFADERNVSLTRQSSDGRHVPHTVDVRQIRSGEEPDIPLQDGDIIFVPERRFGW